ncbi:MAG: glutamine--fructose-6-phosphate transaminase (isomerizing) [Bacillota bacterium]|nr:glutamine--fructose-6-phosphate transaminase (isomerizing) [Bacillota bacterium]MDW7729480.1 glutamine--fructose-6-phosphate transaminase (isomerizing) [Bacillota bacterium]
MCGIVGYAGNKEALAVIIDGLKKLEYRGYDSAGVAFLDDGELVVVKSAGSVAALEGAMGERSSEIKTGIGHTRWATHGRPTDENAHPHRSCCGEIALIHNGIIENYRSIRQRMLDQKTHTFSSETDTEVLAHLIEENYEGDLLKAVRRALKEVKGSYGLVAISSREPGRLVCARQDSPLVIGLGKGENLVASDIPAIIAHTRRALVLEDGEFASVTMDKVEVYDHKGLLVEKDELEITWDIEAAEKGGYDHFMLKEIMEQPAAVKETMRQRINASEGRVDLSELEFAADQIKSFEKIYIVACGTAYHAGLLGKTIIERLANLPVEVEVASEFRYREPLLNDKQLVIVISQSGETADTLAALRLAREKGVSVLAITNVVGSSVSREADRILYTWAGPEIAVASTKAYLTQLIALYLIAIYFGEARGTIEKKEMDEIVNGLAALPAKLKSILTEESVSRLRTYCEHLAKWESAFFIGRNLDYPVAMEGALKLKEISYIHAEAYAAGELKHGPLALIVEGIPVIALATQQAVLDKTLSNIQEVIARGGAVFAITQEGFNDVSKQIEAIFYLPPTDDILAPVLSAVPTQLIAYYAATARGSSVDKPRNLAKSVTVE